MINLCDHLRESSILDAVEGESKRHVLQILAGFIGRKTGVCEKAVLSALVHREHLGATSMPGGIAFPHCEIEGLENPFVVFARLAKGVDFDDGREEKVDLLMAVLVPPSKHMANLRLLSQMTKMLRDKGFHKMLREAKDGEHLYHLIKEKMAIRVA